MLDNLLFDLRHAGVNVTDFDKILVLLDAVEQVTVHVLRAEFNRVEQACKEQVGHLGDVFVVEDFELAHEKDQPRELLHRLGDRLRLLVSIANAQAFPQF